MTLARRFQRRHAPPREPEPEHYVEGLRRRTRERLASDLDELRESRESVEQGSGPRGHFLSALARHAVSPRPRRRAFDAAELARAHMLAEALHPDGHCTCGGGGSCEWCRSHCLFCGCSLTGAFCAACGQEAGP
jgi:hypothetical protein